MRLWIDDSGEKEYGPKTSRFFVYCGVVVDRSEEPALIGEINDLKVEFFGTKDVELKSNWLRIPKERQKRYLDEFRITDQRLSEFTEAFYEWLAEAPVTLLASVIDKELMIENYGENAHYPSATAYLMLMQRFQHLLEDLGVGDGGVVMDDMAGATPKGNQHRQLLIAQHQNLKRYGSKMTGKQMWFERISDRIKFTGSHTAALIQVADLCAYNTLRQFRTYHEEWDGVQGGETLPMFDYFGRIAHLFRKSPQDVVDGYGIVKFPRKKTSGRRPKWAVTRG